MKNVRNPAENRKPEANPVWALLIERGGVEQLASANRQAELYPSRQKLAQWFELSVQAARWIEHMSTTPLPDALLREAGDDAWREDESAGHRYLRGFAQSAERVLARITTQDGRGKTYPEHNFADPDQAAGPNLMELCALWVCLAWAQVHGRWPKRSAAVKQLCETLAHAAGLRGDWGVDVWRTHISGAKKYLAPHPAGVLIAQRLAPVTVPPEPTPEQIARRGYRH
jgi:hypothetical protein